jgi:apolipoprotein N-acyltransferase
MLSALALTGLSVLLYAGAFPPASIRGLAWVALVPWLLASARVSPRRAAILGAVWGVATAYGVAWWLPGMVARYFEGSQALGWVGFFAVILPLFAVYFAAFGAWVSWVAGRGVAGPLLVAAGWGACELARSRLVVGNPWALIAYSQVDYITLMQVADVAGPYGIGMLVGAVNAGFAGLIDARLRGSRPRLAYAAVAVAFGATLAYGRWRLAEDFAGGSPLTVAVVQSAVERGAYFRPEYRRRGLGAHLALTRRAASLDPDMIIWPENAVSFYLQERSLERDVLLGGIRELDAEVVLGGPHYAADAAGTGTVYHNSIFLLRAGAVAGRYDKQRLLPVAEEQLGGVGDRRVTYAAGPGPRLLAARGARLGAFVCFEAMYPELIRDLVRAGAEVLVNVSNDAWFGSAAAAQHHLDMATVRAIENRRYLVRAATTGYSAVVDPHGRVLAQSRLGQPVVLSESVRAVEGRSPYQRLGDAVAWAAVGYALFCSLATRRRRESS